MVLPQWLRLWRLLLLRWILWLLMAQLLQLHLLFYKLLQQTMLTQNSCASGAAPAVLVPDPCSGAAAGSCPHTKQMSKIQALHARDLRQEHAQRATTTAKGKQECVHNHTHTAESCRPYRHVQV